MTMVTEALTEKIREWLKSERQDKAHIMDGATILISINKNRVFFDNISRAPAKYLPRLRYELQKILGQRDRIARDKADRAKMREIAEEAEAIMEPKQQRQFRNGIRADHDSLPEEIKALYTENDTIRARMRKCHEMLKSISEQTSSCPDSDRYPWAKELIELNNRYKDNWRKYDTYEAAGDNQ